MGRGYYAQLRDVLLAHGCVRVRDGKGSHEIWQSPINGARFPVSMNIMSRHTANAIMRQAGIDHRF
jgi:predicted RNA binding protein YcfA (HicA-like mRNA interferase family)